ncbi:DUF6-domain-containing protein [Leucogyrophana mollusca]|uniref:DUF6-domain-containing protein n=1 Tax=Leucogyrophana mollusca TaxID=85980 RepID=A0ACB8BCJ1_9AGAM|nr:DUF6-domain-containing protein [Leucogyrophana mollusca]
MSMKHAYSALTQEVTARDTGGVTFTPAPRSSITYASDDFYGLKGRWRTGKSRVVDFCETNAGMLFIMFAQLFFCFMNLAVKILNSLDTPVPTLELIAVRMAITFTCCVLYMVIMKIPDPFLGPEGVRLLLVSRGLCGFFGLFGMYYSLQYLSLADATVLTFLNPLTTAIAGYLILKENYSKKEALAAICSLFGVILIARPPIIFGTTPGVNPDSNDSVAKATPGERLRAVGVALIGVVVGTFAVISMRAIGKRAHPLHSMTFFSLWCVIVSSTAMGVLEVPIVYPKRWEWGAMLLLIGLFGFFAQTLVTMGLQRETAARSSMGVYLQVIFAAVLEYLFFGTVPSLLSLFGAAIIMISAVYVVLSKKSTPSAKVGDISLESEDSTLEEGLLQGRESGSESLELDEVVKLETGGSSSTVFAGSLEDTVDSKVMNKE